MSQSLAKLWSHLIFSTKERHPFLSDRHVRDELHAYMASILRNHDCPTLQIGGVADHIHALFVLSKNSSIAQIVYEVKRGSSKWIKTQGSEFRKFLYNPFRVPMSVMTLFPRVLPWAELLNAFGVLSTEP